MVINNEFLLFDFFMTNNNNYIKKFDFLMTLVKKINSKKFNEVKINKINFFLSVHNLKKKKKNQNYLN